MPDGRESMEIRKSMAFDLYTILDERPEQQTYTAEEIKKLIKTYILSASAN